MCCLSSVMPGYCLATSSARRSHHGMLMAMPLLLVASVTCFFGRLCARSNANFSSRSAPLREYTDSWITISRSVPSYMMPPSDVYSPSVFSRTT